MIIHEKIFKHKYITKKEDEQALKYILKTCVKFNFKTFQSKYPRDTLRRTNSGKRPLLTYAGIIFPFPAPAQYNQGRAIQCCVFPAYSRAAHPRKHALKK